MSLPGSPGALVSRTEDLARAAAAISDAATLLNRIAVVGTAAAIDVLSERGEDAARSLERAHTRYADTADALATYTVELQSAHDVADDADERMAEARRQLDSAEDLESALRTQRARALLEDDDTDTSDRLADELSDALWERANAQARYDQASADHAQAHRAYEEAAERAITRINHALDDTNDSVWDHLGAFAAGIGDFLESIGEWIMEVLKGVVDLLVQVLIAVAIVLAVILIIAMAVYIISSAPWLVAGLLVALVVTMLLPGLEAERVRIAALLIGTLIPLAGGLILWRILSDVMAPTPTVRDYVADGTEQQREAAADAEALTTIDELSQFALAEGYTDQMGAADKTVVDIKQVIGPDGVARWVVTLPSTQDWQALQGAMDGDPGATSFGDPGATNDVDSNIALMLTPELRTQYERAVLDAMERANIGPDDEVMLVGFSQGGIMAGHLAANRGDEYNFTAVLAYGSPIDAMNIPSKTEVLSIQHPEPVHELDFTAPPTNLDHWTTISTEAYDVDGQAVTGAGAHNNDLYRESIDRLVADGTLSNDHFAPFMGDVEEHHRYEWNE
jgi:pimeloyl-ACP methyl ester carboxylesterase